MVTLRRELGDKGEEKTCLYLKSLGYNIIERNYLRKWGEIDIIAEKGKVLYFIEVKTIQGNYYRPEENMSQSKRKKLRRTIGIYLLENNIRQIPWKFILSSVVIQEGSNATTTVSLIEEVL